MNKDREIESLKSKLDQLKKENEILKLKQEIEEETKFKESKVKRRRLRENSKFSLIKQLECMIYENINLTNAMNSYVTYQSEDYSKYLKYNETPAPLTLAESIHQAKVRKDNSYDFDGSGRGPWAADRDQDFALIELKETKDYKKATSQMEVGRYEMELNNQVDNRIDRMNKEDLLNLRDKIELENDILIQEIHYMQEFEFNNR